VLDGLAVALALSTLLVLAALLRELGALESGLRGLVRAALATAALTTVAFLPSDLLFGSIVAALVGAVLYGMLVALWRPADLTRSWGYLRALR
jgi:uncharacterized membrane protein YeaQ/YmgE (transglycosylase-associated protein family)